MKKWKQVLRIGFTYIGTMVGAGFATGQEILQFFTRYGSFAAITILIATIVFIWLGTKMMLIAQKTGCSSYEDLNILMFGQKAGSILSAFMALILFGTTAVMLAGAGSIFSEHLGLPFQLGLILTLGLSYIVLVRGIDAIMAVNAIIVPLMLLFTGITVMACLQSSGANQWLTIASDVSSWKMWLSPLLYVSLNLSLAQAVLVPIGANVSDRTIIRNAGWVGGIGMGLLLLAGHFSLSTQMPGIAQFEIPSAFLIHSLGKLVQLLFLLVIYCEIFTTLIADAFGLNTQIRKHIEVSDRTIIAVLLIAAYFVSQVGFSKLVSTLYPMFGLFSLGWLAMLMKRRIA